MIQTFKELFALNPSLCVIGYCVCVNFWLVMNFLKRIATTELIASTERKERDELLVRHLNQSKKEMLNVVASNTKALSSLEASIKKLFPEVQKPKAKILKVLNVH